MTAHPFWFAQIENYGVHVSESGFVAYGLRIDAVMDRIGKGISLVRPQKDWQTFLL